MKGLLITIPFLIILSSVSQANTTMGATCVNGPAVTLSKNNPSAETLSLCYSKRIKAGINTHIFEDLLLSNESKTIVVPFYFSPLVEYKASYNALCSVLLNRKSTGTVLKLADKLGSLPNITYTAYISADSSGNFQGFHFGNYASLGKYIDTIQCI